MRIFSAHLRQSYTVLFHIYPSISRVPFVVYHTQKYCVFQCISREEREMALNVHESECLSAKERVALVWKGSIHINRSAAHMEKCECYRIITATDLRINTYSWNLELIHAEGTKRPCVQSHALSLFPEVIDRVVINRSAYFFTVKTLNTDQFSCEIVFRE